MAVPLQRSNFKFSLEYQQQLAHIRPGKKTEEQQRIIDSIPRNEVEPLDRESRTSQILEMVCPEEAIDAMFAEDGLVRATHPAGYRTVPEDMQAKAKLKENKETEKKARLIANPDNWESDDSNQWNYDEHDRDYISDSNDSQQSFYSRDKDSKKYKFAKGQNCDFQSSADYLWKNDTIDDDDKQNDADFDPDEESWVPSTQDGPDERRGFSESHKADAGSPIPDDPSPVMSAEEISAAAEAAADDAAAIAAEINDAAAHAIENQRK